MKPMPTIYPHELLRQVVWIAMNNEMTLFDLYHSSRCEPPTIPAGVHNIRLAPSDLVGDGRLLLIDSTQERTDDMTRIVTSVHFNEEGAVVEFVDPALMQENGPSLVTALHIPRTDADWASEIDDVREAATDLLELGMDNLEQRVRHVEDPDDDDDEDEGA